MQIKQVGSLRGGAQAGFTLIELIVVIVILGILAATALPKFANVGTDARIAKLNAARAAVQSGVAMYHGRWLAAGSPSTGTTTYDGVDVNTSGYPTDAGMKIAAGGLTDYTVSGADIQVDASRTSCKITYTAGTGAISAPPASTSTACD